MVPRITVTKKCQMCGKDTSIDVDIDGYNRWRSGELIQNVWPEMSPDQQETLISGTHPECWAKLFLWGHRIGGTFGGEGDTGHNRMKIDNNMKIDIEKKGERTRTIKFEEAKKEFNLDHWDYEDLRENRMLFVNGFALSRSDDEE